MDTNLLETSVEVKAQWLDDFSAYLSEREGSQHTHKAYLSDVRIYAEWYETVNGEAFSPAYLTNTDLRAFRKWSDQQGVKAATWNRRRAALRVLWGWSKRQGMITHEVNIFDGVRSRHVEEQEPKWLEEAAFRKMERHLENEYNRAISDFERWLAARNLAMFRLMAYAGLREAEVCALLVSDVKLSGRSGSVEIRHGKGDKARRVPLVEEVRTSLAQWISMCGGQELFTSKDARPLGVQGVQDMVHNTAVHCGLGHITPHQLRHTFCHRTLSQLVRKGAGDKALITVAKMAGHSRLDVTLKYVKPSDDEMLALLEG